MLTNLKIVDNSKIEKWVDSYTSKVGINSINGFKVNVSLDGLIAGQIGIAFVSKFSGWLNLVQQRFDNGMKHEIKTEFEVSINRHETECLSTPSTPRLC